MFLNLRVRVSSEYSDRLVVVARPRQVPEGDGGPLLVLFVLLLQSQHLVCVCLFVCVPRLLINYVVFKC